MPDMNPNTRASSTKFVYVGCKLPTGLKLELFHENTVAQQAAASTGVSPMMFRPPLVKASFTLKGANSLRNDYTLRGLAQPGHEFAINRVPEDFWREWYGIHKEDAACKNGFIFALPKEKEAIAEGKLRASERSGFEPLNPTCENDPRLRDDMAVRGQGVQADHEHLRRLQTANGRD